jgi:hypothetical protein
MNQRMKPEEGSSMRRLLAAGVMALCLAGAGGATAAPVCAPSGHCYDYINRNLADTDYTTWTWEGARADAQARTYMGMRGHLATLTSRDEEQVLIDNWLLDILYGQPWLGGFRAPGPEPKAGWQWVTGEPFVYANWLPWEPNGADELFLHYQSYNVGPDENGKLRWDWYGWNDASDQSRGTASYFIEYAAVPLPAPLWLMAIGVLALSAFRRRSR